MSEQRPVKTPEAWFRFAGVVTAMGPAAAEAARAYSWAAYHERVVAVLRAVAG